MSSPNKLSLDFRDNAELKAALGGLSPGDRTKIEIEVLVSTVDDERFTADVEQINVEGSESAETEDAEAEVSAKEPVMILMTAASKRKPKNEEPSDDAGTDSDE